MACPPVAPRSLLILALAALAGPAPAGNLVITGHDDDYHMGHGSDAAKQQFAKMVAFARAGAPDPSLPVLVFDHGAAVDEDLQVLGVKYLRQDPDVLPIDPRLFDVGRFSAIVVASDQSCGGCDNDHQSAENLAASARDFARFFNAGGGIVALAGADEGDYYKFLPATASASGHPNASYFTSGPAGVALGIPPVDGDPTHNFFATPGTAGEDRLFQVVELYSETRDGPGVPATLAIENGRIAGAGFTQANKERGTLMDAATVVVTFGLLAFLVERLTNGLAIVLGYWPWWRAHMELAAAADPQAQAAVTRNRRVALFAVSALIAVVGSVLAKLDLLTQLGVKGVPAIAGYLVSGLLVASGADPIRELIQNRGNLSLNSRPEPAPIQVTGTLVVSGDVARLNASEHE